MNRCPRFLLKLITYYPRQSCLCINNYEIIGEKAATKLNTKAMLNV